MTLPSSSAAPTLHRVTRRVGSLRWFWSIMLVAIAVVLLVAGAVAAVRFGTAIADLVVAFRLPLVLSCTLLLGVVVILWTDAARGLESVARAFVLGILAAAMSILLGVGSALGFTRPGDSVNSLRLLVLAVAMAAIAIGGSAAALTAFFVYDTLVPPGPALVRAFPGPLWPYGAYAVAIGVAIWCLRGQARLAVARARSLWGFSWLFAFVIVQMALTPFYAYPSPHSWQVFLPALFVPGLLLMKPRDLVRLTALLMVAAFLFQVGLVLYKAIVLEGIQGVVYETRYAGGTGRIGGSGGAVMWVQNLLIVAPFALLWLRRSRLPTVAFYGVVLLACYAVYRGDVRAGTIALTLALVVFLMVSRRPGRAMFFLGLAAIAALSVAAVSAPFVDLLRGGLSAGSQNNASGRIAIWIEVVREMMSGLKIAAIGLGKGTAIVVNGNSYSTAHNLWAQTLHVGGLLSLGLMLGYYAGIFRGCIRALRVSGPHVRETIAAMLASLTVALVFSFAGAPDAETALLYQLVAVVNVWAICRIAGQQESLAEAQSGLEL